jgi:hypothetical protein
LRINWNPVTETWRNLRIARDNIVVFRSLLGISWMWFFGAVFLSNFPSFAKDVLHGDEHVLHRMRELDGDVEADHARGALERVRGAHQRLDGRRIAGALELDEAFAERGGMRLRLSAKEFVQREAAKVAHAAHAKLLFITRSSCS